MDLCTRGPRTNGLLREVQERDAAIRDERALADGPDVVALLCECSDFTCFERIAIDVPSYAAIRRARRRSVVRPGHVVAETDEIVEMHDTYDVVETKRR